MECLSVLAASSSIISTLGLACSGVSEGSSRGVSGVLMGSRK